MKKKKLSVAYERAFISQEIFRFRDLLLFWLKNKETFQRTFNKIRYLYRL